MSLLSIIVIAIGLSMDAFAVAITWGIVLKNVKFKNAFMIAFYFWFFQFLMPIIWWLAWIKFKDFISSFDHWIAFLLLSFIWWKMFYEAFKWLDDDEKMDYTKHRVLTTLAIATSIDALAVWLSFSLLDVSLFLPAVIIWIITFVFSFAWVYIWRKFGHLFEKKVEIVWGLILIWIWVKILLEHTILS